MREPEPDHTADRRKGSSLPEYRREGCLLDASKPYTRTLQVQMLWRAGLACAEGRFDSRGAMCAWEWRAQQQQCAPGLQGASRC